MNQIPDDPSVVKPIFDQLKKNFRLGITKQAQFRKNSLKALLKGYKDMKADFEQAHQKDLHMSKFLTAFTTHHMVVNEIKDLLDNVDKWMKPRSIPTPITVGLASSRIQYEPLGVTLVVSAWNYPIYTSIPQVAAGIAAGNCVILKPSEVASHTSNVIQKLFENYLDPRFFRCIEGKIEVAKAVTKLPLDLICFTGSTMTGRLVAIEAAKNLTPCLLELGGKCPTIVDQSAKIQNAVLRILSGKYLNCGQTCIGVDHVYVHESLYKEFRKAFLEEMDKNYGNQNLQENPDYGRIINSLRTNRLEELLKDNHGGEVIYGGQIDKQNKFISPSIVENPNKDSLMMQEEIFGPIMPLFSYSSLDDVIEEINSRSKPLAVYLFSQNQQNIKKVKDETYSGAFVVNETVLQMVNLDLPFGGVGMSGYGRYHGESGFINFSNPKSILESKAFNPYPLTARYGPFDEGKKKLMLKLIDGKKITYGQIGNFCLTILIVIALALFLGLFVIPRYA